MCLKALGLNRAKMFDADAVAMCAHFFFKLCIRGYRVQIKERRWWWGLKLPTFTNTPKIPLQVI